MIEMYQYRGGLEPFVGKRPRFSEAVEGAAMLVEFVTAGHTPGTFPDRTTLAMGADGESVVVEFVWHEDSTLRIVIDAVSDHTVSVLSVLPGKGMAGEELGLLMCKLRPLMGDTFANSYRELDVEFEGAKG